jgi:hypothetical protein
LRFAKAISAAGPASVALVAKLGSGAFAESGPAFVAATSMARTTAGVGFSPHQRSRPIGAITRHTVFRRDAIAAGLSQLFAGGRTSRSFVRAGAVGRRFRLSRFVARELAARRQGRGRFGKRLQLTYFFICQTAIATTGKFANFQGANRHAFEPSDFVAQSSEQSSHLTIFSFAQNHFQDIADARFTDHSHSVRFGFAFGQPDALL